MKLEDFAKVMSGQQQSIRVQLNESARELVASNRRKLQSIVETIVFCGHQSMSLRGHRDSGLDVESSATASHGNFWALLEFLVAARDSVLRDQRAKAPRNAMYTSPDIQNQIIDVLSDHICQKILLKVRRAQIFSMIADEATDCANKEQLRYMCIDPELH